MFPRGLPTGKYCHRPCPDEIPAHSRAGFGKPVNVHDLKRFRIDSAQTFTSGNHQAQPRGGYRPEVAQHFGADKGYAPPASCDRSFERPTGLRIADTGIRTLAAPRPSPQNRSIVPAMKKNGAPSPTTSWPVTSANCKVRLIPSIHPVPRTSDGSPPQDL